MKEKAHLFGVNVGSIEQVLESCLRVLLKTGLARITTAFAEAEMGEIS